MILDKKALTAEQDQFDAERDQLAERFLVLKAKVAQMGDLKASLEQYEQDKIVHS